CASGGGPCASRGPRESASSCAVVFTAGATLATIPCPLVRTSHRSSPARRVETWLWTGPAGHLAGGALDLLSALVHHRLAHARSRAPLTRRGARRSQRVRR